MAERIFSVDFGTAFTKVALRTAPQEDACLVSCSDIEAELWAPTVVAADWSTGEPRLDFGNKAAGIMAGGKIAVYTNFKKQLFQTAIADKATTHPIDALIQSPEFEELAAKYSVLPPWVAGLRVMLNSAKAMFGGPNEQNTLARKQDEAKRVTQHFFKWLRERTLAACAKLPDRTLRYEDIPLRISVPVFGNAQDLDQHPGCQRLREALTGTGWKLDNRLFVSEPESNAIGILTKATNVINQRTKKLNFREMFGRSPLVTVLAGDSSHPTYRTLVIDIGAYTTDFAALNFDTEGAIPDTSNGIAFTITQSSIPFGVSDLDERLKASLSEEKRAVIAGLPTKEFAKLQSEVYLDDTTGYRYGRGKVIGGDSDREIVDGILTEFVERLSTEAEKFCEQFDPASMQELILTGGGNNIPRARETLINTTAKIKGRPFVKIHAPGLKRGTSSSLIHKLNPEFTRGGSALGGASIYFERSYY